MCHNCLVLFRLTSSSSFSSCASSSLLCTESDRAGKEAALHKSKRVNLAEGGSGKNLHLRQTLRAPYEEDVRTITLTKLSIFFIKLMDRMLAYPVQFYWRIFLFWLSQWTCELFSHSLFFLLLVEKFNELKVRKAQNKIEIFFKSMLALRYTKITQYKCSSFGLSENKILLETITPFRLYVLTVSKDFASLPKPTMSHGQLKRN